MNLANELAQSALSAPDATAIALDTQPIYSYAEFADLSARWARALRTALPMQHQAKPQQQTSDALEPGDRVALVMENHSLYLPLLYGIWHAGLVAVPVNAKLHSSEFEFILSNCGAKVCFASGKLAPVIETASTDLSLAIIDAEKLNSVVAKQYEPLPTNREIGR